MPPKEKAKVALQERSVLEKFDGDVGSGDEVLRERITVEYDHEKKHGKVKQEFFDKKGKLQPDKTVEESGPMDLPQGE